MVSLHKTGMWSWPVLTLMLMGCAGDSMNHYNEWAMYERPTAAGQHTTANTSPQPPRLARSQQGDRSFGASPVQKTSHQNSELPSVPYKLRVCAWVNGTPIFTNELYNEAGRELMKLQNVPEPEYSVQREKILEKVLQGLIDREVVYQDAYNKLKQNTNILNQIKEEADRRFDAHISQEREKLKMTELEYKRTLEKVGISLDAMRRKVEREFLVNEYLRNRVTPFRDSVGHLEIRDYYEKHKNEFQTPDRIEWQNIFIEAGSKKHPTLKDARAFAEQLLHRLQNGEPFANLLPYDEGDSSTRGGKGNGQLRGEIRPVELEPLLFRMKPGQIGLLEISTGVHVFRLVHREHAGQLPFNNKVQAKIRARLQSELLQREFRRVIRELAARTVIEVDSEALK